MVLAMALVRRGRKPKITENEGDQTETLNFESEPGVTAGTSSADQSSAQVESVPGESWDGSGPSDDEGGEKGRVVVKTKGRHTSYRENRRYNGPSQGGFGAAQGFSGGYSPPPAQPAGNGGGNGNGQELP
ncbi:MAG: hypothetical protein LBD71_07465, partial [Treponema sp.]|nr:hypothetical protein [Treponema sp.]